MQRLAGGSQQCGGGEVCPQRQGFKLLGGYHKRYQISSMMVPVYAYMMRFSTGCRQRSADVATDYKMHGSEGSKLHKYMFLKCTILHSSIMFQNSDSLSGFGYLLAKACRMAVDLSDYLMET